MSPLPLLLSLSVSPHRILNESVASRLAVHSVLQAPYSRHLVQGHTHVPFNMKENKDFNGTIV